MPSLSIWSFLWKQVELGPNRQVKPYDDPKLDQSIVARIDPELDEIRYGSSDPPQGKSVANVDHLRVHLSNKFKVQVLEDNQATITLTATGSSAAMRHTDRTQRISFRWLKQQFEVGHFNMINVDTGEQAADIFTKPFVDKPKWSNALRLINHFGYDKSVAAAALQDDDEVSGETHDRQPATPAKAKTDLVESFAKDRLQHKDFSWDAIGQLTRLLREVGRSRTRQGFQLEEQSKSMIFGVWTHSGMQGISTNAKLYPEAAKYVNAFLKHHAPKHTYSSFVISIDAFAPPHLDPHNAPESLNLTMSYGNFTGGEVWVSEEGLPQPKCDPVAVGQWRVRKNEQEVRGHLYDSFEKPVYFSPKLLHATQGWKGERFSVTAFTSRGVPKLQPNDLNKLQLLNFPLPKPSQANATPAKASNRFLVEFCCSEDSKLSELRTASKGCHCIRVTEALDATRPTTLKYVIEQITTLAARDEGGATTKATTKPKVVIFASLPCTGGCTWQRINSMTEQGGERVESHKQLFRKLFRSLRKLDGSLCKFCDVSIAFELPASCDYWKLPMISKFCESHGLTEHLVNGCMVGVQDKEGVPLKKSWRIMSNVSLSEQLSGLRCDKSHEHGESRGNDLKRAESYTYVLTDAIHNSWSKHVRSQIKHISACAIVQASETSCLGSRVRVEPRAIAAGNRKPSAEEASQLAFPEEMFTLMCRTGSCPSLMPSTSTWASRHIRREEQPRHNGGRGPHANPGVQADHASAHPRWLARGPSEFSPGVKGPGQCLQPRSQPCPDR